MISNKKIGLISDHRTAWFCHNNGKNSEKIDGIIAELSGFECFQGTIYNVNELQDHLHHFGKIEIDILIVIGNARTLDQVMSILRNHNPFLREPVLAYIKSDKSKPYEELSLNIKKSADAGLRALSDYLQQHKNTHIEKHIMSARPLICRTEKMQDKLYSFQVRAGLACRVEHVLRDNSLRLTDKIGIMLRTAYGLLMKHYRQGDKAHNPVLRPMALKYSFEQSNARVLDCLFFSIKSQMKEQNTYLFQGLSDPYRSALSCIFKDIKHKKFRTLPQRGVFSMTTGEEITLFFNGPWMIGYEMFHTQIDQKIVISLGRPFKFLKGVID